MTENISNRPDLEEASQARLIEQHEQHQLNPGQLKPAELVDESPLPKGMRERVETVEVSTLIPKA